MEYIQRELLRTNDKNLSAFTDSYKITPKDVKQKTQRLKEWQKFQPHLQNVEMDDNILYRALCYNKFDEEKIKVKIDAMATARTAMPECFQNRHPSNPRVSKALESLQLIIMPKLTEEHMRVTIFKFNIDNEEVFDLDMFALGFFILADLRIINETSIGEVVICDVSSLSISQISQLSFSSIKKILQVLEECYSISPHCIHVINAHPVTEVIIKFIKSILKKKVSDRFTVHSTMESFHKAFPAKYLPKDLGGDEPLTMKEVAKQWAKAIKTPELTELLLRIDKMKSDESKRLEKKDFLADDQLGVRGTLKKLALD